MPLQAHLSSADLRAALRLAGESCELPRGSRERRMHAMGGLAKLVSAQVVVFGEVLPGPPPRLVPEFDFGWAGEAERGFFGEYVNSRVTLPDPSMPGMLRFPIQPVMTMSRGDLIDNRDWYRSAHVQELRKSARVDAFIYSGWIEGARMHAFSLHRAWGEREFTPREKTLIDAFHSGCPWLHELKPVSKEQLPRRLQEVLDLLAGGASEKQVAAALSLSQHTVHDYVKALHKRFGVASRGELLARVLGS